jgi:multidrug efflux pump subunit AcrA (membrane-fusion protein)
MKYRFKALERRRQPDQLDSPMMLANPRGWVAVFVVLITAVLVGVWGLVGQIPRTLQAAGLLEFPGGIASIQSPGAGTVSWLVGAGTSSVAAGDVVAVVTPAQGGALQVTAPVSGRVVSVDASLGAIVAAGSPLAGIEARSSANEPLQVSLFVDAQNAALIRPGQPVQLGVPGVPSHVFGLLRGTVDAVSRFPLSDSELRRLTGSALGAGELTVQGVGPRQVIVSLEADPQTMSGYAWTSDAGPPTLLESRTPVSAQIEVGNRSPLSMLLGG